MNEKWTQPFQHNLEENPQIHRIKEQIKSLKILNFEITYKKYLPLLY